MTCHGNLSDSRRIIIAKAFDRMLDIYPSSSNGITMCQANFALMGEDIPSLVKHYGEHIHFVHFRNIRGGKYKFEETFHDEGIIDMYDAMKVYYDIGFRGQFVLITCRLWKATVTSGRDTVNSELYLPLVTCGDLCKEFQEKVKTISCALLQ